LTEENLENLNKIIQNNSKRFKSSEFTISEINRNTVYKMHDLDFDIYAVLINESIPLSIFNLVLKIDFDGNLIDEKIFRYKMDPRFGLEYYSGDTDFHNFAGLIEVYEKEDLFRTKSSNFICASEAPCCIIPSIGSSNTSGNPNPGGGNGGGDVGGGAPCEFDIICLRCFGNSQCSKACHPDKCICDTFGGVKSSYMISLDCAIPVWDNSPNTNKSNERDCCPSSSNTEIPIVGGPDPSTIGDEDVPTDFTSEFQAGLNSTNFLNEFLGGESSIDATTIVDAAECAGCIAYAYGEDSDAYNECVLTQLLNDAPCNGTLTQLIEDFELNLSPAQQLNLVGPSGLSTSTCANGSVEDILLEISENELLSDPILTYLIWKYIEKNWTERDSPYNNANECEADLIWEHPSCALGLGVHWISVNLLTKKHIGQNSQNNCSDAFRHTLFNALNAAWCGVDIAEEFGNAHECETDSEKARDMDLHNNSIGYSIIENNTAISNALNSTNSIVVGNAMKELIGIICTQLSNGEMQIFSNPTGNNPDFDDTNMLISSESCSCLE